MLDIPCIFSVGNEHIGFGLEQTFSKEVDDKANAYFQVSVDTTCIF